MERRIAAGLVVSMLVLASVYAVPDTIGEIVYVDGDVRIMRENRQIDQVDFGFQIENFDQIITGERGTVEIALYPETGIHASVQIASETVLYFDISSLRSEQRGALELLTGTVNLSVARLSGQNSLDVRTASAIMGVRGTVFSVSATALGDVLLATDEGRVECRTAGNQVLFAIPGEFVEKVDQQSWRNITVEPSSADAFRTSWFSERIEALETQAPRAIAAFARRYTRLKDNFIQSYVRLMNNREIIQTWMDQDRLGIVGDSAERSREKRQIVGSLIAVRMQLFQLERIYYRLDWLIRQSNSVPGNTDLGGGLTYRTFQRQFEEDSQLLSQRMQEIRYILKLYALRNDGQTPFDAFSGDFLQEEDFFDDEGEYFF